MMVRRFNVSLFRDRVWEGEEKQKQKTDDIKGFQIAAYPQEEKLLEPPLAPVT